jgi:hypothetical protein
MSSSQSTDRSFDLPSPRLKRSSTSVRPKSALAEGEKRDKVTKEERRKFRSRKGKECIIQ